MPLVEAVPENKSTTKTGEKGGNPIIIFIDNQHMGLKCETLAAGPPQGSRDTAWCAHELSGLSGWSGATTDNGSKSSPSQERHPGVGDRPLLVGVPTHGAVRVALGELGLKRGAGAVEFRQGFRSDGTPKGTREHA